MSYDDFKREGWFLDVRYGDVVNETRLAEELWKFKGKLYRVVLKIAVLELYPTTREIWEKSKLKEMR